MKKTFLLALCLVFIQALVVCQPDFYKKYTFSKADTLRGMLRPERTCYDVTFYDLNIAVDVKGQYIKGYVDIFFNVTTEFDVMQIDLYRNMKIKEITLYDLPLTFHRLYDAVFVNLPMKLPKGFAASIRVVYEGYPTASDNAPWEGGFVWEKDQKNNPWVGVACEGDGASLWWPCKDHLSDEPDSMAIHVAVPGGLAAVANGNLRKTERLENGYNHFYWFVSYPVNTYAVSISIGQYVHFSDTYIANDGDSLALDYYVLPYNLEKAKKHFQQVKPMLACYEHFFGKYPFWRDGFALVETPYLGMEHQSGIAYGNNYNRGYLGGMIPRDMDWDYLIIHEAAHEYFGNAVTVEDACDLWIHESLATFMEALYVECRYSPADAVRYLENERTFIRNLEPMTGPRNVNFHQWTENDHYFKGSWMLHTLRSVLDNDVQFFGLLRGFYEKYRYSTCMARDFISFTNDYTRKDFSKFFDQYLNYTGIPKLAYELEQIGPDLKMRYSWEADVTGFDMPVKVGKRGSFQMIYPVTGEVREMVLPGVLKSEFEVPSDMFYIRKR
jgi:aminopeptidase N